MIFAPQDWIKLGLSLVVGGLIFWIAMAANKVLPKAKRELLIPTFSVIIGAIIIVAASGGISRAGSALDVLIVLTPFAGVGLWMVIVFYVWASTHSRIRALEDSSTAKIESAEARSIKAGLDGMRTALELRKELVAKGILKD